MKPSISSRLAGLLIAGVVTAAVSIAAATLFTGEAGAQTIGEESDTGFFPRAAEVSVGISYRNWSIKPTEGENFSVRQFVLPAYAHSVLRDDVEVSYLFNIAHSNLAAGPGETGSLSGITDGKLALNYFFPDRRFSAGLGLRVPTGKSRLDPEEEAVASQLAERIFGFRVKHYGEGTDVEMRGGFATLLGNGIAVSAGASYLMKGDFQVLSPVEQQESTYQPGNELSALASARGRAFGREWTGRVQFTSFGTDRSDGTDVIKEGSESSLRLRVRDELLFGVVEWETDALWKGDTDIVGAGGLPPTRDVSGSILRLGGAFSGRIDRLTELGGRAGVSWYGESDRGVGDGLIFELGPRLKRTLRPRLDLNLGYSLFFGHAENGTVDLTGQDVTLAFGLGIEAPSNGRGRGIP